MTGAVRGRARPAGKLFLLELRGIKILRNTLQIFQNYPTDLQGGVGQNKIVVQRSVKEDGLHRDVRSREGRRRLTNLATQILAARKAARVYPDPDTAPQRHTAHRAV